MHARRLHNHIILRLKYQIFNEDLATVHMLLQPPLPSSPLAMSSVHADILQGPEEFPSTDPLMRQSRLRHIYLDGFTSTRSWQTWKPMIHYPRASRGDI